MGLQDEKLRCNESVVKISLANFELNRKCIFNDGRTPPCSDKAFGL